MKTYFTCIGKSHGAPVVPATREDWEKKRSEQQLLDMCRRIAAGEENLKKQLPIWTPCCSGFANNHRSIKDALQPLNRLMLDFDEKGHSQEILERSLKLQEEGKWEILLVEESVRKGTHVLIALPEGMSAEEAQIRFSEDVGFQADPALKDVARCIYMVPMEYTLYQSEKLFNEELRMKTAELDEGFARTNEELPSDGFALSNVIQTTEGRKDLEDINVNTKEDAPEILRRDAPLNDKEKNSSFPAAYEDIPYSQIIETLEEQMGGQPEHGSRNNFIFSMACHLRYVCNDDAQWIAQVLPTYGEAKDKWMASIKSACSRNQTKTMPKIMKRTLAICKQRMEESAEGTQGTGLNNAPPPMPKKLPSLIRLLVSKTPKIYQPAVAHAVFPALGAHLWKTYFRYIDNVLHEATLMNVLMAGTGAGKNCISDPINHILKDIRLRDKENLLREKEWKKEMQTKGANKDKRQRPEGLVIQEIDPDMTNAAFVQRLADAEERFLYTKMNEIDQFDALKTSARSKAHFQIMCLAFDPGNVYGQTRVGTGSVSERVCIRFNWNASTTIRKGQAYFRSVLTDGPVSRINFCTIPERPIGSELPVYGTYDVNFDEELRPYIECLNKARGVVECRQARALAKKLIEECADFARLSESRVYENLSFRANVIAYLKACVLYVAHGERWDKTMEDFVRWSLRYDLWCKMRFFGEAIEEQEGQMPVTKNRGPQNLLDLLPEVFTREEAQQMRQRYGVKRGTVQAMLDNWKHRGYITLIEAVPMQDIGAQKFRKTEKYLKDHPQK